VDYAVELSKDFKKIVRVIVVAILFNSFSTIFHSYDSENSE
jgi:hypothetical protein